VAPSVFLQHSQLGMFNSRNRSHYHFADIIQRYNALAGIADPSNSFFLIPVAHFPWSDKGRERRQQVDNSEARAEV
jgi:hypothetical protein